MYKSFLVVSVYKKVKQTKSDRTNIYMQEDCHHLFYSCYWALDLRSPLSLDLRLEGGEGRENNFFSTFISLLSNASWCLMTRSKLIIDAKICIVITHWPHDITM